MLGFIRKKPSAMGKPWKCFKFSSGSQTCGILMIYVILDKQTRVNSMFFSLAMLSNFKFMNFIAPGG